MFVSLNNRNNRPAGYVNDVAMSLIDEIPTRLSRVASQMIRDVYNEFGDLSPVPLNAGGFMGTLQVDVTSDANKVIVRADVPGMKKDELIITLSEDNVLTISGERVSENKPIENKNGEKVLYKEIRYGKFSRSIPLGEDCDANGVHAKLDQGVLHVVIPKVRPVHKDVRKISIT